MSRRIKVYINKNQKNKWSYREIISVLVAVIVIITAMILAFSSFEFKKNKTITSSSIITHKRDYQMENLLCETLSGSAVKDGWKYYYVETTDSGAALKDWVPAKNNTALELGLEFTNLSKEETKFAERVSCKLIYDENKEINAVVMQENPGQKAKNGEKCRSTAAVAIKPKEKTRLWFMADIPEAVRDSDGPFTAVITVDDEEYSINLRENMNIFS